MGSGQSSISSQTNTLLNETLTNMVNSTTNKTHIQNTNNNSFSLSVGNLEGCDINLTQEIKSSQDVTVNIAVTNVSELQNQVQNALTNAVSNSNKSQQGFAATSLSVQNSEISINNAISNLVKTNISNATLNALKVILANANKAVIYIDNCKNSKIEVAQDMISSQIVNVISNSLVKNTQSTSAVNTVANTATSTNTSEQKGVSELVDSVGNILGGPFLIFLLVIGGGGLVMYKGTDKMKDTLTNPKVLAGIAAVVVVIVVLLVVFKKK